MRDPDHPRKIQTWSRTFRTAHSLWIDTDRGLLFVNGSNGRTGGMRDPRRRARTRRTRSEVGAFTDFYIHDSYTRGNVLFASAINDGFEALLDVSDPRRIREITRFFTGGRFTHNSWLTRDGRYLFTTDERTGSPSRAGTSRRPTAPRKVTQFIANPAAIAHNVMIDGDRLLVSHYTEGVYLLDVRNPEQPRVIGSYDTYPGRLRRLQRGLGRLHLPGLEPHRGQRHLRRPVRARVHRPVILRALGITRGDVVAVVGAGGKTTLVYRLAGEARACGLTVLVTTTTHMGTLRRERHRARCSWSPTAIPLAALAEALAREGRATLLGRRVRPDKLEGIAPARVDALAALADLVLVEADGARGRSLKVPAPHEPVIPRSTTLVVVVCALDALGQPLDEEHVHRVELVRAATGVEPGEAVDEDCLATALRHPDGYPSRIPPRARARASS